MRALTPFRPGHRSLSIAFALALISLLAPYQRNALASGEGGVYTLVDRVEIESRPDGPDRILIHGVSSLAFRPSEGEFRGMGIYSDPEQGYLYFECGEDDDETCALEWKDLKAAEGDEECAAYGYRYLTNPKPNGRLRPLDEPAAEPDPYPIGQGVVMTLQGSQRYWSDDRFVCELIREKAAEIGARPEPTPTEAGAEPSPEPSAIAPPSSNPPPIPSSLPPTEEASTQDVPRAFMPGLQKLGGDVPSEASPDEAAAVNPEEAAGLSGSNSAGGTGPARSDTFGTAILGLLSLLGAATILARRRSRGAGKD